MFVSYFDAMNMHSHAYDARGAEVLQGKSCIHMNIHVDCLILP